ncbi:MAG: hypothetical protein R3322_00110 [Kiloniellales bacterium]|nr:hypothetical protein [Kiloniellales bacterium]
MSDREVIEEFVRLLVSKMAEMDERRLEASLRLVERLEDGDPLVARILEEELRKGRVS